MCWSESQTNPQVKAIITSFHSKFRTALIQTVTAWQRKKVLKSKSDPGEVAKAFLSFFYGFIVQGALMGDVNPESLTRGMKGLQLS